jgi:hypothetical protein
MFVAAALFLIHPLYLLGNDLLELLEVLFQLLEG